MDESAQRILEYLTEVEVAAEDILSDKQQVGLNDKGSRLNYSQTNNDTFRLNSVYNTRLNVDRSWIWIRGETEIEKHSALYETIPQTASTDTVYADLMNTVRLLLYSALLLLFLPFCRLCCS